jgi:deoxyribodipyrimidine photo-lyase
VFIREAGEGLGRAQGGAANWWLNASLQRLEAALRARGIGLVLRTGEAAQVLGELAQETGARRVAWNRRYGGPERERDTGIKAALQAQGLEVVSHAGHLLNEPWSVVSGSGGPYRVFTPYWRAVRAAYQPPPALPAPQGLSGPQVEGERLADWGLHPRAPDWSMGFDAVWQPGEDGARQRLTRFIAGGLAGYGVNRNRPDVAGSTSGLSAHLAFGEISAAAIWRAVVQAIGERGDTAFEESAWVFLSEIVWREFSYVLLWNAPDLASRNWNAAFDAMPWREAPDDLRAWQRGLTGYPIVDAGMRQLWQTGWMHNRVRMIVASFLTKHLLIDWRRGEDWFWDTLVDADPASNAASWQWTAGSGADAAPYFRVFNPITQGRDYDPDGLYVRRFVPELARVPLKYLHAPWEASQVDLSRAHVTLGVHYPRPIVDHKVGRERALSAYEAVKRSRVNA